MERTDPALRDCYEKSAIGSLAQRSLPHTPERASRGDGHEHRSATHHTARIAIPKWKWPEPKPRSGFWDGRHSLLLSA